MTDEQGGPEGPVYVAVRCQSCGDAFRVRAWKEGMSCPRCRAAQVQPVPAPGGAVDYLLADRRHGTTQEDVVFAEWARWCGYITANQYNAAVHRQNSDLQSSGSARPIHEVMISLESMDEVEANGLLRFLALRRPNADDEDFVARLLRQADVDPEEVQRTFESQRATARKRNEVPPVAQLLVQKRVITESRMLDLLQEQARDGTGALKTALDMSKPPPRESAIGKAAGRLLGRPGLLKNAAIVLVLGLAVWGVWSWRLREHSFDAYGQCSSCGAWVTVPWTAAGWPAVCPRCRLKTVRFAVECPRGHVFLRASPFSYEHCPECGADMGRPLTEEEFRRLAPAPPQPRKAP
jgi:Zn finger protein HypA/HybF involved in hydrogenase expression